MKNKIGVKKFCLLLSVLLTGLIGLAQNGRVTGRVLNNKNEPLAGVSVKVTGTPGGTTTDVEGRYSVSLASGKTYEVNFSAVGYTLKTIEEVQVTPGQSFELNVILEVADKSLSTVTVTGTRSSARRETTASIIQFQKNTNTDEKHQPA